MGWVHETDSEAAVIAKGWVGVQVIKDSIISLISLIIYKIINSPIHAVISEEYLARQKPEAAPTMAYRGNRDVT